YVIGEGGVRDALLRAGIVVVDGEPDRTDLVIVGWDRSVDYAKLRRASLLVQRGAALVATNPDLPYPAPDGLWPGAGSIPAAAVDGGLGSIPAASPRAAGEGDGVGIARLLQESELSATGLADRLSGTVLVRTSDADEGEGRDDPVVATACVQDIQGFGLLRSV